MASCAGGGYEGIYIRRRCYKFDGQLCWAATGRLVDLKVLGGHNSSRQARGISSTIIKWALWTLRPASAARAVPSRHLARPCCGGESWAAPAPPSARCEAFGAHSCFRHLLSPMTHEQIAIMRPTFRRSRGASAPAGGHFGTLEDIHCASRRRCRQRPGMLHNMIGCRGLLVRSVRCVRCIKRLFPLPLSRTARPNCSMAQPHGTSA